MLLLGVEYLGGADERVVPRHSRVRIYEHAGQRGVLLDPQLDQVEVQDRGDHGHSHGGGLHMPVDNVVATGVGGVWLTTQHAELSRKREERARGSNRGFPHAPEPARSPRQADSETDGEAGRLVRQAGRQAGRRASEAGRQAG